MSAEDRASGENTSKNKEVLHSPEEIEAYIYRNYPELSKNREVSIGLVSGNYRIAVVDKFHVLHTLKIEPKEIDRDRLAQAAAKGAAERLKQFDPEPDNLALKPPGPRRHR